VTRDELVEHVAAVAGAVTIPVTVDAEHGYATDPAGVAQTVELLADAGAAGLSIEDFDPVAGAIMPLPQAIERVVAAAEACHGHGLVLTARAENLLHAAGDLDDTITRLLAYQDAGADALYAPGLRTIADVERVVGAVARPVNVLALPDGPSVAALAAAGVRRVSTGGALAWVAYGALEAAATELLARGVTPPAAGRLTPALRTAAFASHESR
jgi:2-methylisocitrate lyase-like PEP mutase family enzyme